MCNATVDDASLAAAPATPRRGRVWPPLAAVGAFWILSFGLEQTSLPISSTFMTSFIARVALLLVFLVWWFAFRGASWKEKFGGFAVALIFGAVVGWLSRNTLGPFVLIFTAVPIVITVWNLWAAAARWLSSPWRQIGFVTAISLVWFPFTVIRTDGLTGDLQSSYHWRWTPTAEQKYLAEKAQAKPTKNLAAANVAQQATKLQPGDWPGFRGPARDGIVREGTIRTDWENPPKLLWRRHIGPAWSSMIIVDGKLYTQEQQGDNEVVACHNAATGEPIWTHEDKVRYWDGQSGAGPRATPEFSGGALYTVGGKGTVNCLEPSTGTLLWTRDLIKDTGASTPMWGFSSSPLVTQGLVIIYAGGPSGKGLIAYHAETGKPAWTAETAPVSFSSPQLAKLGGKEQVLLVDDKTLWGIEPKTGKPLWKYAAGSGGMWRVVQPIPVGDSVLFGGEDMGLARVDVAQSGDTFQATEHYTTQTLKPSFNDYVIQDGYLYGFDAAIFCCIDIETGKRVWKGGRYGHGQVILLAEQKLLIVSCESGEVVLLDAAPKQHEYGRFQAIEGKTWNHPAFAHGHLYVRSDEEMACYDLSPHSVVALSK